MITISDVENRISQKRLIELTQDDLNANDYDIVKVEDAIDKSISLVKAYLRGTDYENSNEDFIKEITLDICVYFLYKKRYSELELQEGEKLAIYRNYENAIKLLEDIRNGKLDKKKIKAVGTKFSQSKNFIYE
jgi:phage gp36-like protein